MPQRPLRSAPAAWDAGNEPWEANHMRSTMRLTWALICTAIVGAAGTPAAGNIGAEFAAILKSDFDKWAKAVKAAGLRAD